MGTSPQDTRKERRQDRLRIRLGELFLTAIGPYFEGWTSLGPFMQVVVAYLSRQYRGMSHAVLVERDRKALAIVAENIQMTKEVGKFQLPQDGCRKGLGTGIPEFDLIFLDPPYAKEQIVSRY